MQYLTDAATTLCALAACHAPAASALMAADQGALLGELAQVHDRLLPQVWLGTSVEGGAMRVREEVGELAQVHDRLLPQVRGRCHEEW